MGASAILILTLVISLVAIVLLSVRLLLLFFSSVRRLLYRLRHHALVMWGSRRSLCAFSKNARSTLFALPSLMDAKSFTSLVNRHGHELKDIIKTEGLRRNAHLRSSAYEANCELLAQEACRALTSLKQREVEELVYEKYGIKDDRLVTCLVPYQIGANIILSKLPPGIRKECVEELRAEEEARKKRECSRNKRLLQWEEHDVYLSTGLKYLRRISKQKKVRIPIFSILGHPNHGKTTLLDSFQGSQVARDEPHSITQAVRCFTVTHPLHQQEQFTFVDTPGHRLFAELRFHAQLISDYIIILVSVPEGIQSQTHEAIKVALNVDKPIIVVLNKIDTLSDPMSAQKEVRRILSELGTLGLDVTLVRNEVDLDNLQEVVSGDAGTSAVEGSAVSISGRSRVFFAPMKELDPGYKGSIRKPSLDLRRQCVGVCISAKSLVNIPLLWRVLRTCRDTAPPTCYSTTAGYLDHNCTVQAVVVESSKHLFDEEGFRQNTARQRIQAKIDGAAANKQRRFEKSSVRSRMNSSINTIQRRTTRTNRTSTTSLVLTVIVKEGVITRGMNFVSDQSEGQVEYMVDYWGVPVERAVPGMVVTLIDAHSVSGCPSAGIHVLSTVDAATRYRVHAYRQRLQWYVECFPKKLHYLKPRGMDTSFIHLGDYGQIGCTDSLEYQLLYGPPPSKDNEKDQYALPGTSLSFGDYLLEKNRESELQVSAHDGVLALSEGRRTNRLGQSVLGTVEEEVIESTWKALQPTKRISSQEEYERFVRQCLHVGVFLKVDSWHSARMLHREISRLGTKKVVVEVVGVRFGGLTVDDIRFFGQSVKIVICYRTPRAASIELDNILETNDLWLLETDHFADVLAFAKWCAVATHKGSISADEEHADVKNEKLVVDIPVSDKRSTTTTGQSGTAPARRSKLLRFLPSNDDDSSL